MNGVRKVSGALRISVFIGSNAAAVLYAVNTLLSNELATLLKRFGLSWTQLNLRSSN